MVAMTEAPPLTDMEKLVLRGKLRGMNREQIAAELCVSVHTVKFHLANIREKRGGLGKGESWWFTLLASLVG